MDFYEFNHLSHIIIGTIAFIGGIIALSTKKGSKIHKSSGWAFVLGMFYAAVSTIGFMIEEFLPLAVLMSIATIYLLTSSLAALRYKKKYSSIINIAIIILPFLLFIASSMRFISVLPEISMNTITPLLLTLTFAIMLFRDIKLLKNRPTEHLFFLKRHAFRMILAFGFAFMAVLRIAIKVDLFGLEFTTFFPLLLALITAFYAERNISKFISNKK